MSIEPVELRAVARRDLRLEAGDLLAGARELVVDRALLGAPVLELSPRAARSRPGRLFSRSSRSARAFSISSSSSRNWSSVERISFSTPSISFNAARVLAAGLHAAQLRLVLLLLLLVVGELALGLALLELGLGQRSLERRDGLDLAPGTRGRPRRDPAGTVSRSLLAVVHEPDAGLEPVELFQKIGQREPPENEKGCSACGTPFSLTTRLLFRSRIRSLKTPRLASPRLVGPLGFEPRSDRL